jgi:Ca2+-binding EF-hand superfamily protein
MFDIDKSGKIDKEEVVALLSGKEMSNIVPQSAIEDAIKEIDQDGDGEIDFEEFI